MLRRFRGVIHNSTALVLPPAFHTVGLTKLRVDFAITPKSITKTSGVGRVEGCQDYRQQCRSWGLMSIYGWRLAAHGEFKGERARLKPG
jgi:hypothetical protein